MLYVLQSVYEDEDGDVTDYGVLDGPAGVNVDKLLTKFMKQFEIKLPKYPTYKGPMKLSKWSAPDYKTTAVCSGLVPAEGYGWLPPTSDPVSDTDSPEYKAFRGEHDRIYNEWNKQSREHKKQILAEYNAKTEYEAFVVYLQREHGFKKVEAEWVNL